MTPADADVIAALDALREEVENCSRCVLHESRTRAVFGEGDPGADLMFVGEAPGYHEDQQGRPFVGQAGKLLEQLLGSIQLTREQVYIANVLKSRPPNNRDPRPEEIEACQPYLWRQIALIKPRVICTLGNFATKLLSGNPAGITRVHGHPQVAEIGGHKTYLYPIFHPAAALYTPSMLTTLKEDFQRLPELLSHAVPQTEQAAAPPAAERPAWLPPQRRAAADTTTPVRQPAQADLLAQAAGDPPAPEPDEVLPVSGGEELVAPETGPGRADDDEPATADPMPAAPASAPADPPAIGAPDTRAPAERPEPVATPDPAVPADVEPDPDAPAGETPASPGKPEQLGLF